MRRRVLKQARRVEFELHHDEVRVSGHAPVLRIGAAAWAAVGGTSCVSTGRPAALGVVSHAAFFLWEEPSPNPHPPPSH